MKISSLAFLACTSAPLLLALTLPADELSFHPAANAEIAKTLKIDAEINISEATVTMNGEPIPGAADSMTESALLMNMVIGVTEKYVETKEGKPIHLLRTFDKMSFDTEFGAEATEVEEFKEPEGKTVEFKWNEKEGAYDLAYKDSEGDAEELKDLDPDMDLRALLPAKKVAKGDTWQVPADQLKSVFLPGGMITKAGDDEQAEAVAKMKEMFDEQFSQFVKEFKVNCTYNGTKEEGGATMGEITFAFDGKMSLDLGTMIEELIQSQAPQGMPEMDLKATAGMSLKGEGTMLWNPATGTLGNFEMHATAGFDVDMNMHMQQGDMPMDFVMKAKADGKIDWELAPTPAAAAK